MPTAEVVFFPVKKDAPIDDVFANSKEMFQKHQGFKALYLGTLVEDPKISCLVIEWNQKEDLLTWTRNYDADKVKKNTEAIVDMYAGLDPFATFIDFAHDPSPSFNSPVTELGFFSLPDKFATEKTVKEKLIGTFDMSTHPVITIGKAKGAAVGHVFAVKPEMAMDGYSTRFAGAFGYDSVEDHQKWRETPEHAEVIKGMNKLVEEFKLAAVDTLGKRRAFIEGSGILHVKFVKIA